MIEGINTWRVNERISVVNGKAEFLIRDENNQPICNVICTDVYVSEGSPIDCESAKDLRNLSEGHKLLLNLVLDDAEEEYTEKQMNYLLQIHYKSKGKPYDPVFWNLTLNQLLYWKCFTLDGRVFAVNTDIIEKYLESGRFQS